MCPAMLLAASAFAEASVAPQKADSWCNRLLVVVSSWCVCGPLVTMFARRDRVAVLQEDCHGS
jgi:hypothetical protein